MVMCCLTVLGVWGGIRLQQRFLRNYLHLKLFGYDDGQDPPVWQDPETKKVLLSGRDPIEDQDGCFFSVFFVTTMTWWIGLKVYSAFLLAVRGDEKHQTDSGMYGLTFASYNLILGGLFTWVCDFYTLVAVVDQMLQSIHNGASGVDENSGYVAYGKLRGREGGAAASETQSGGGGGGGSSGGAPAVATVDKKAAAVEEKEEEPMTYHDATAARLQAMGRWWSTNRVWATRTILLVGWPGPLVGYMINYFQIVRVLDDRTRSGSCTWSPRRRCSLSTAVGT